MRGLKLAVALLTLVGASALGFWGTHQLIHNASPANAHWAVRFAELEAMAFGVDLVAVGTVIGVAPGRVALSDGGEDGIAYTNVTFALHTVLKGSRQDRTIVLEQTGGVLPDGSILSIDDGGPYERGERYLLFLNKQPDSSYYYLVHPQGRFLIKAGRLLAVAPRDRVASRLHKRTEAEAIAAILSAVGRNP